MQSPARLLKAALLWWHLISNCTIVFFARHPACLDSYFQPCGTAQVRKGVSGPESIADHMYRMGMMALICGDAGVDTGRCIRMALVHDVAEALVRGSARYSRVVL